MACLVHMARRKARDDLAEMLCKRVASITRKERHGWNHIPRVHDHRGLRQGLGVDERHGTNAFIRQGDQVFRAYFINNRGDEQTGSTWNYLDITALGRQETWEDSPEGYPRTPPYQRWNYHDAHDAAE